METFKIPLDVPQDLLLIHDIVGAPLHTLSSVKSQNKVGLVNDNTDSSSSDNDSEEEIQTELIIIHDDEDKTLIQQLDTSSESESGSESELDDNDASKKIPAAQDYDDDEEESGPTPVAGAYFQTKNEFLEADIIIPEVDEIGPNETLDKVGEIISVMDNLAIIKGLPSELTNCGSERALDSDTLLVFKDRKVMGYIYETFGPTSQPLYQVKFNEAFPLDPDHVKTSREVFHVPSRSKFIFINHIKHLKGSDASNVHDEEPADNELDFSDDEAEAAFRSSLKRKRGLRTHSVAASSRQSTPTLSHVSDQDLTDGSFLSRNPYDEYSPYDLDFIAGPSRPAPIPYDDPYSDPYTSTSSQSTTQNGVTSHDIGEIDHDEHEHNGGHGLRTRDRGRGRRGRSRGWKERGDRGRRCYGKAEPSRRDNSAPDVGARPSHVSRALSPTSLAIARATGQLHDGSNFTAQHPSIVAEAWDYSNVHFQHNPHFQFGLHGYSPALIQPHINPRFASAFGLNTGSAQPQHFSSSTYFTPPNRSQQADVQPWEGAWTAPSGGDTTPAN